MTCKQPLLNLKTRPRFRPVSLSLSMTSLYRHEWDKHSSLFSQAISEGEKLFMTLTLGPIVIKKITHLINGFFTINKTVFLSRSVFPLQAF
jgi:hypothetical protein